MNDDETKNTDVSVIVITKNNAYTIQRCITGLLNQNYPKNRYEIVFVDGHSVDGTRESIEKYSQAQGSPLVKLYYENVGTMGYARNLGISKAQGKILVFTDGDAYPTDNWLREIVQLFNTNRDLAIAGGLDVLIPQDSTHTGISSWRRLKRYTGIKAASKMKTVNLAILKDVAVAFNGFDPTLSHFDESELMARLYFRGNVKNILFDPQITVFHERKMSSLSDRIEKLFKKSVIGVPTLLKKHMVKMALTCPVSTIGTSMFFIIANLFSIPFLILVILGIIPYCIPILLATIGLVSILVYSGNIMRSIRKFLPGIFFVLTLDCIVRFFGTFFGMLSWAYVALTRKWRPIVVQESLRKQ